MTRTRIARIAAASLALAAAAPAGALADGIDLRTPDARAAGSSYVPAGHDLRSPDARVSVHTVAPAADLRSPDARSPQPSPVVADVPAAAPSPSGDLDSGPVLAVALALLAAVGGAGLVVSQRRRPRSQTATG